MQHYAFRRIKCAGLLGAGNTFCFAVSMFHECASPKTHAMQPFSCAFRQRHCESPTLAGRFLPAMCRSVMSRSESGLCGKHGNGACRSDNLRGTYSSKPCKAKILSEAYVVWRRVMVFSIRMRSKVFRAKNIPCVGCAVCENYDFDR